MPLLVSSCLRGKHPRQMGSAAGTGDDDVQASIDRALGVPEHFVGHAVSTDDLGLMWHAEPRQDLNRLRHRWPVA